MSSTFQIILKFRSRIELKQQDAPSPFVSTGVLIDRLQAALLMLPAADAVRQVVPTTDSIKGGRRIHIQFKKKFKSITIKTYLNNK